MRQWMVSAFAHIMACRLFGTKPLSEPVPNFIEFQSNYNTFYQLKCIWSAKWRPFSPRGDELIFPLPCTYNPSTLTSIFHSSILKFHLWAIVNSFFIFYISYANHNNIFVIFTRSPYTPFLAPYNESYQKGDHCFLSFFLTFGIMA